MRRSFRILAAAGALAILAGVVGWTSAAGTGPATIRIVERQFGYTRVDVGRHGLSPGDSEIITSRLFNKRVTQKPIGSGRFICTFTNGLNRTCIATIGLPKGQLVATGAVRFREFYNLAVVGGTGLYDNARGTLTVIRTTRKPARDILLFRLAG
ncbi:MAG TPA: hypothetical protein VNT04_08435 [Gaiellaceae bacterium]|jgi:hypothetical protein|nr:hypothetical protein [Gaiellaceae bacterium]